jgi:hypothetical protein
LLVALVCGGSILALSVPMLATPYGFPFGMSSWAGAIAIVVTYVVAGLRPAPPPYQRYANLSYGVASWFPAVALTLPVPDQGFTTIIFCGLPFAALGGLVGGALYRVLSGSASPRRLALMREEQRASDTRDTPGQGAPEEVPRSSPRPAAAQGLAWRLIAAVLLGAVAVPFGPGEPETLWISLLVLGWFAGIAIVLDLSLLGWRPGLLLLLGGVIAIVWGGGNAIVHATGSYLFALPTGAVPRAPFEAFVGLCAVLCLLAVDGARWEERSGPGERRMLGHLVRLLRLVLWWLAIGLSYWLGVALIMVWRGWPGMLMGSETPGQIPFTAALPPVLASLPAALLGALAGGAVRWALLHPIPSVHNRL